MSWLKDILGRSKKTPPAPAAVDDQPAFIPEADQVERKAQSEMRLKGHHVPINPHLPMIESEAEVSVRTGAEIEGRLLALSAVAGIATDYNRKAVEAFAESKNAKAHFTSNEAEFFADPNPDMHDRIQFSWQYECAWVLLWALHLVDEELSYPSETCSVSRLIDLVCTTENLTVYGVRTKSEILREADLIYRFHWAVRDADLNGREAPRNLHGGVVMERHRALNWLIRYNENADWEEVTTDT
jgi:hypothetical protein